ncbi:hypothetical protein BDF14DRAFT_1394448 [Spinellus fusiger]|nr:hypothetical protein BDF14DRAFT_1394448 [Spinellus fusiger]
MISLLYRVLVLIQSNDPECGVVYQIYTKDQCLPIIKSANFLVVAPPTSHILIYSHDHALPGVILLGD